MNLAMESNLASPAELGEVDGSENNRLSVKNLKILSSALAAGIVISMLPTNPIKISAVFFSFH
jgi:hypothetical protein